MTAVQTVEVGGIEKAVVDLVGIGMTQAWEVRSLVVVAFEELAPDQHSDPALHQGYQDERNLVGQSG